MEEQIQKNKKIQYTFCPLCTGVGFLRGKVCMECKGVSVYASTPTSLLYWSRVIDVAHNKLRNLEIRTKNIINIILLVFGCIGIIIVFWNFYVFSNTNTNISKFFFQKNFSFLFFWISVFTDCYLLYRFSKDVDAITKIPKKLLHKDLQNIQGRSWAQLQQADKNDKVDVSQMYSERASKTITHAYEIAQSYGHFRVGPVHIFISLLSNPSIVKTFARLGINFTALKRRITNIVQTYATPTAEPLYFTTEAKKIFFESYFEAWHINQKKVEPIDILLAIVKTSEVLREVLYDLDVDIDKIVNVSQWHRFEKKLIQNARRFRSRASLKPKSSMDRAMTAVATPYLDQFSTDLTLMAKLGRLDSCIGRKKEIKEIFRIMKGGTRQTPVLLGPPGIGKKTIVNGIAQRMVEEDVPPQLQDKRLVSLNVARLTSGANASEAGQRLLIIINEIARAGNIVLFINNVSQMIGISQGGAASVDLAGVLSQALRKRQLLAITDSLDTEYARHVENKSGLDEVLEKVIVKEVEGNEAIQILEAKSSLIEFKYRVFFSYDAIEETVKLSSRYLHERYLPEKAIEIMEETAVTVYQNRGEEGVVTAEDIAITISEKTEIPLTQITKSETEKLLNLEDEIHKYMVDQEEAVTMVATAIRRARAEMRDNKRPIVNLLFLGSTGVGKTELAKTIIRVYFGAEREMIRLDMSEYQQKDSINRLIGSPPSGSGDPSLGFLTENVRKNPFSLVLLDEIEKAHPEILNIFLQVMDDGRLTDTTGRVIDFTNVIIIATSNAGSLSIQNGIKQKIPIEEIKNNLLEGELQQIFRPELLNRFDGIVLFKPLSMEDVRKIARLMLGDVEKNLEERGVSLKVTDGAIDELAEAGFDPKFGARPLRRVIQQKVNDVLANYFLSKKIDRRDTVLLDVGGKVEIIKAKKL